MLLDKAFVDFLSRLNLTGIAKDFCFLNSEVDKLILIYPRS